MSLNPKLSKWDVGGGRGRGLRETGTPSGHSHNRLLQILNEGSEGHLSGTTDWFNS